MKSNKGFFVAFEGIDGSGKSTQSVLFYRKLKSLGYQVSHTRPGENDEDIVSPINRAIKRITHNPENEQFIGIETEVMLYMAQGAQATDELIIPELKAGRIVVADRYVYSVYALCHYGRNVDFLLLREIGDFTTQNLIPDVIVLTDLPASVAFKRKEKSGKKLGRKELMGPDFFEKVRQGFLSMSEELNPDRWLVVDDNKMSIEEAEKYIWDSVMPIIQDRKEVARSD